MTKKIVIMATYQDKNGKTHQAIFETIEDAKAICPNGKYQQVPFYN